MSNLQSALKITLDRGLQTIKCSRTLIEKCIIQFEKQLFQSNGNEDLLQINAHATKNCHVKLKTANSLMESQTDACV